MIIMGGLVIIALLLIAVYNQGGEWGNIKVGDQVIDRSGHKGVVIFIRDSGMVCVAQEVSIVYFPDSRNLRRWM